MGWCILKHLLFRFSRRGSQYRNIIFITGHITAFPEHLVRPLKYFKIRLIDSYSEWWLRHCCNPTSSHHGRLNSTHEEARMT
jgi:hypothetical protein